MAKQQVPFKLFTGFVLPSGLQFMQSVKELHRLHALFLHSLETTLASALTNKGKGGGIVEEPGGCSYEELKVSELIKELLYSR
jgi:hypothetical protein